jgi:hypothetical protein
MITIKIKKCAKGGLAEEAKEVGTIKFTGAELEIMALKIWMLTEDINEDKFEYSAQLDTINV